MPRIWVLLAVLAIAAGCCSAEARAFEAEVHRTPISGSEIAWYERGRGAPLLMLAGTGSTMAEWDPALLRLLARKHRLVLVDYPGTGLSGPWRGRSFSSLATAMARFMRARGLAHTDVLGWSMGGFVAQRLAIEHPGRVARLILAGTNPGGPHTVLGTPAAQAVDSDPDPPLAAIMRELYPAGRQAEGARFLRRLRRAAVRGEIPDDFHVAAATVRRQVAAEGPWLRSNRNYKELARLATPTLVTAGAADPVTPAVNMRLIAARLPEAELRVFPGAHAFLFQARRRFAHAVGRFLSADGPARRDS